MKKYGGKQGFILTGKFVMDYAIINAFGIHNLRTDHAEKR